MAKNKKPTKPARRDDDDDDDDDAGDRAAVTKAVAQVGRIQEKIEGLDSDNEFLEDVYEKAGEVAKTIELMNFVSERQQSALDNWEGAVDKFVARKEERDGQDRRRRRRR